MNADLRTVPTLDELAADPTKAAALTREERFRVGLACSSIMATLALMPLAGDAPATADLLDATQIAARLHITRDQFYELAKAGDLPIVRIGKYIRVRPDALDKFIRDSEADSRRAGRRVRLQPLGDEGDDVR